MLNYEYDDKKHLLYWPESPRMKNTKEDHKKELNYTMPGIKEEYVRSAIDHRFTETYNRFFPKYDLDLNQRGLLWFIKKGLFDAALNGTSDMLTWLGQGPNKAGRKSEINQICMEVWSLRFQLLINMRMHSQLLAEIAAFEELDAPDLYYQYKTNDKTGSLVPFSLRLIHAEALRFSPFPWKSLIQVQALWTEVEKIVKIFQTNGSPKEHVDDWEKRLDSVKLLFIRVLYNLGEYKQTMVTMEKVHGEVKNPEEKVEICRTMMRMAMQAGDEKAMNICAEKLKNCDAGSDELILHKTMKSIFLGSFSHAQDYIYRVPFENGTPQIINTRALVQLYTGRARDAVETISEIKPIVAGSTTTNLKTIAELCYSTAAKDELLIS